MAKKQSLSKASNKTSYSLVLDLGSLAMAVLFLASVIKNAAVAAGNVISGGWGTTPLAYALILGLVLIFISWYQSKGRLSTIAIIALTILLTSTAIWMLGLHITWPLGETILETQY